MPLESAYLDKLASQLTIDMTTYGRSSGDPQRVEIWWFRVDGRFVITGTPGRRDWMANIASDSRIVIHALDSDIEATAVVIEDAVFRRRVFNQPETNWYSTQAELDQLVKTAPMIEVLLPV